MTFTRESREESKGDGDKLPAAALTPRGDGNAPLADDERLEAEVIRATPNGFEPSVITRPSGRFFLGIRNQSGSGELVLRLSEVQGGGQLYELRLRPGRRSHYQLLELSEGEYILTEARHPRRRCQIIISRRG